MKSIVFHNREKIFSVSKYLSSNASSLFGKSRGHKSAFYEESMYLEIRFEAEICDSNWQWQYDLQGHQSLRSLWTPQKQKRQQHKPKERQQHKPKERQQHKSKKRQQHKPKEKTTT